MPHISISSRQSENRSPGMVQAREEDASVDSSSMARFCQPPPPPGGDPLDITGEWGKGSPDRLIRDYVHSQKALGLYLVSFLSCLTSESVRYVMMYKSGELDAPRHVVIHLPQHTMSPRPTTHGTWNRLILYDTIHDAYIIC